MERSGNDGEARQVQLNSGGVYLNWMGLRRQAIWSVESVVCVCIGVVQNLRRSSLRGDTLNAAIYLQVRVMARIDERDDELAVALRGRNG